MGTRSSISGTSSFRDILVRMALGQGTLSQMAESIGIPESSLRLRLDHMERSGYVERMLAEDGHCTGGCRGCCSLGSCNRPNLAAYRITEKGRSLMR